ncbi:MAG: hypothetical protein ACKVOR_06055, partial [Flavobacteriales bacterium]
MSFPNRRLLSLITCLVVSSTRTLSQASDASDNGDFEFALRGKILGYVIVEDVYVGAANIGGELIYNERHSLGADVNWFRWKFQEDDDMDVAM